jgi:succinyl-CoA synthetase beta subunit
LIATEEAEMADESAVERVMALIATQAKRGRQTLSEPDAKVLLQVLGISVPRGLVVRDAVAAQAAFEEIGPPVAIKAVAFDLTHKTKAGGVVCPVDTALAAVAACNAIAGNVQQSRPDVVLEGFLVEAYCPATPEWILTLRVDPQFGPTIMFGLGGIYVEVLHQLSFRLAPLRERDIDDLLNERSANRILEGMRGRSSANYEALKDAIRRLSELGAHPGIARSLAEIEINPLAIHESGVVALDALVVLSSPGDRL